MRDEIATRDSWSVLKPMPEKCTFIELPQYYFTAEDFEQLSRGFVPDDDWERWFIYYEDQHLYFHRSWGGALDFDVKLVPFGDGCWALAGMVACREPEQYRNEDDDYDREFVLYLIAALLLKVPWPVPEPPESMSFLGKVMHNAVAIGTTGAPPSSDDDSP